MSAYTNLAYKYRPLVLLPVPDTNDGVRPLSIENICNSCDIVQGDVIIKDKGTYTPDQLSLYNNPNFTLRPDLTYKYKNIFRDVPIYVGIFPDEKTIVLQYCFLYAVNPGYNILGVDAGYHLGDLEHITIVVNKSNNKIQKIYFSAHNSSQGQWVDEDECNFDGDRVIVYSAYGSNATYVQSGCYPRIACFANDVCPSTGVLWDANNIVVLSNEDTPWAYWLGRFGTTQFPGTKSWWGKETDKSITPCGRLCGCLSW